MKYTLFLCIGFCFFTLSLLAQKNNSSNKGLSPIDIDTAKVQQQLLLFVNQIDWSNIKGHYTNSNDLQQLNSLLSKAKGMKEEAKKTAVPKTSISGLYSFLDGDTTAVKVPLVFANLNASSSLNVLGIPLSLSGTAIFLNGKLDTKLSALRVNFDYQKHLESMKERLSDAQNLEKKLQGEINNPLQLSDLELKTVREEQLFQAYHKVLSNPIFVAQKQRAKQKLDSIQQYYFCRLEEFRDSTLKDTVLRAAISVKSFEQIESTFEQLWQSKKMYEDRLTMIEKKAEAYQKELTDLENPELLKKRLLANRKLPLLERIKTMTKDFDIGQYNMDVSDYTCKYLLLNGIRYHFDNQKQEIEIAYGKQHLGNPTNNGFIGNSFFEPFQSRTFLFLGIGTLLKDSTKLHFNLLKADDADASSDSSIFFPKHNFVIETNMERKISKLFAVNAELAFSQQSLYNSSATDAFQSKSPLAFKSHLVFSPAKKENINVQIGYFRVEPSFNTLGNPFLLRNREGLSMKMKLSLFKNKLISTTDMMYGFLINPTLIGMNTANNWQLNTALSWKVSQQSILTARYVPNTIWQQKGIQNTSFSSNIYLLQGNFNIKTKKTIHSLMISMTNLNQNIRTLDSVRINQSVYVSINHSVALSKKNAWQSMLLMGLNKNFDLTNAIFQTGFKRQDKKYTFDFNLQSVKRINDPDWMIGFHGGVNINWAKNFNLGVQFTTRQGISDHKLNHKFENFGTSHIRCSF